MFTFFFFRYLYTVNLKTKFNIFIYEYANCVFEGPDGILQVPDPDSPGHYRVLPPRSYTTKFIDRYKCQRSGQWIHVQVIPRPVHVANEKRNMWTYY